MDTQTRSAIRVTNRISAGTGAYAFFQQGPRPYLVVTLLLSALTGGSLLGCGGGGNAPSQNRNPLPTISSMSPSSATAGDAAFALTVIGANFVPSSTVLWNGSDRSATFVSSTTLQAPISTADIATASTVSVTVSTPAPGGGTSGGVSFTIKLPIPVVAISQTDTAFDSPNFAVCLDDVLAVPPWPIRTASRDPRHTAPPPFLHYPCYA